MKRYSGISTTVLFGILTLSQPALAAEGTIFTPGPIVINYGNTAVARVSNHGSTPLVNVVIMAVGGKDVIEFRQSLRPIRPRQTVDILFPAPRDPSNWQPIAFVPDPQEQDSVYFDLFIQQGTYTQATFSDPPTSQYPNRLWRAIPGSGFTPPDVLTYGDIPHVSSRTLGPINSAPSQPGDGVFVKNLSTTSIRAFLYCLDANGQKVQGCGGVEVIQAHDYSAIYPVQLSKPVFFVLCADGEASLLWVNLLVGSVNYPNELWDVHVGPAFCAGDLPHAAQFMQRRVSDATNPEQP
jgi:hypothetical protein